MNRFTVTTDPTKFMNGLKKHVIGLDDMFDNWANMSFEIGYPPYNIIKVDDDEYKLEMAVAGFGKDNISVTVQDGTLTIAGNQTSDKEEEDYLHRGISTRNFTRTYNLAEHIKVNEAVLKDGMLMIQFRREVPEELKPMTIKIK